MYDPVIESKKSDLENIIARFKEELAKLRTGRANPALVENIPVECYGSKMPLKQMASISVPEARLITINPWDKSVLSAIEAAISASGLGLNPNNDGQIIRLNIPPLNEERRQEMVKVLNQKTEEFRVAVRNIREEIWRKIQEMEKNGEISEDEKFKGKDKLQEVIDEYNQKIEELREGKEKEIITI